MPNLTQPPGRNGSNNRNGLLAEAAIGSGNNNPPSAPSRNARPNQRKSVQPSAVEPPNAGYSQGGNISTGLLSQASNNNSGPSAPVATPDQRVQQQTAQSPSPIAAQSQGGGQSTNEPTTDITQLYQNNGWQNFQDSEGNAYWQDRIANGLTGEALQREFRRVGEEYLRNNPGERSRVINEGSGQSTGQGAGQGSGQSTGQGAGQGKDTQNGNNNQTDAPGDQGNQDPVSQINDLYNQFGWNRFQDEESTQYWIDRINSGVSGSELRAEFEQAGRDALKDMVSQAYEDKGWLENQTEESTQYWIDRINSGLTEEEFRNEFETVGEQVLSENGEPPTARQAESSNYDPAQGTASGYDPSQSDAFTYDPNQSDAANYDAATIDAARYDAARARAAQYDATRGSVSDNATVRSQMEGLLSEGSRYMEEARLNAAEQANSRGLLNSTMAAGAGERAAIQSAMPIAQQDASTYHQQSLTNQRYMNEASRYNAGNRQQVNLANQQAENQASQFNAGNQQQANLANQQAFNQANQFNAGNQQQTNLANQQALNQAGQFNANNQQQASQFNTSALNQAGQFNAGNEQQMTLANMDSENQAGQFNATADMNTSQFNTTQWNNMAQNQWSQLASQHHDKVMKNLDTESRAQLINLESRWNQIIERDKSASSAYMQAMDSLSRVLRNNELSPQQQQRATNEIIGQVDGLFNFLGSIDGARTGFNSPDASVPDANSDGDPPPEDSQEGGSSSSGNESEPSSYRDEISNLESRLDSLTPSRENFSERRQIKNKIEELKSLN